MRVKEQAELRQEGFTAQEIAETIEWESKGTFRPKVSDFKSYFATMDSELVELPMFDEGIVKIGRAKAVSHG